MCLFLFLKMFLEFRESSLQVSIYFYVPCDNSLHPPHILVNIVFNRADSLHIRYQFTLFSQQLCGFLQVLKVAVKEFLLFFYNSVDFFVESKELLGVNHVLTGATPHPWLTEATLAPLPLVGTCPQGVLEVVPILFLLLFELLLITKLLVTRCCHGGWVLGWG
jgi:hypothetical protein